MTKTGHSQKSSNYFLTSLTWKDRRLAYSPKKKKGEDRRLLLTHVTYMQCTPNFCEIFIYWGFFNLKDFIYV